MKQTVKLWDFRDIFNSSMYKDKYSYYGLQAIYEYLEEVYDGNYNLDVVEVACWFSEYDSLEDYNQDMFGTDVDSYIQNLDELMDEGYVLLLSDYAIDEVEGFIVG